jgi:hypothetical protein
METLWPEVVPEKPMPNAGKPVGMMEGTAAIDASLDCGGVLCKLPVLGLIKM